MLKITYTDTGLILEQVAQTVEALVAQRMLLTLRLGQSIAVQPTYASLPLPADLPGMAYLQQLSRQTEAIAIDRCDSESDDLSCSWLEVTIHGVWIAESASSDEGIFVTELEKSLEQQLMALWQQAQRRYASARRVPKVC
ncbi:alr0857 family protein [Pseudanabaena sp. FACHB-2040]|uniref:alr0857 family protein n=1 Tax=Pseudanabaena sp. FACHB-2040 TaxID=2692859 RepID=UPI001689F909|nr:alr0857 family protein [Pseudanabaena sp. FACHB-2040]MBD2257943.1 hypothetical protein [Pseudanabaena sp. FACHB-2040]